MSQATTCISQRLANPFVQRLAFAPCEILERMGMSQATTATSHQLANPSVQRLANPSAQRLANARYEHDGEDGYEPGYNSHHSRPCSEKGEYTCKAKARYYFLSLYEINWFYFSRNPQNLWFGMAGTVVIRQIIVSKEPRTVCQFFAGPLRNWQYSSVKCSFNFLSLYAQNRC